MEALLANRKVQITKEPCFYAPSLRRFLFEKNVSFQLQKAWCLYVTAGGLTEKEVAQLQEIFDRIMIGKCVVSAIKFVMEEIEIVKPQYTSSHRQAQEILRQQAMLRLQRLLEVYPRQELYQMMLQLQEETFRERFPNDWFMQLAMKKLQPVKIFVRADIPEYMLLR